MLKIKLLSAVILILSGITSLFASAQTGGNKPVQFTCTLNGVVYTCDQLQNFVMARGITEYITSQSQDLLFFEKKDASGLNYSSVAGPGFVQMITTVKDEEMVSIVLGLAAPYPKDSTKWLNLSLSLKGILKGNLKKLPLKVPIVPASKALKGNAAVANVTPNQEFFTAVSGEVVIESIDYTQRRISGFFHLEGVPMIPGRKLVFGEKVKIEGAKFKIGRF